MTSIDRTAYPQLGKHQSEEELSFLYALDTDELGFIRRQARNDRGHLVLATLLKTRQQLGYFIGLEKIPKQIISNITEQLDVAEDAWRIDDENFNRSLYRYHAVSRERLGSTAFSKEGKRLLVNCVRKAAHTMSDPADLINVAIEVLTTANIDLPAFSRLDRLVGHERQEVHTKLYGKITGSLTTIQQQTLDALLVVEDGERITGFAKMNQSPGPATLKHFRAWVAQLAYLESLLDPKPFFEGVAYTKIRQFAAEASVYALGDVHGITNSARRILALKG